MASDCDTRFRTGTHEYESAWLNPLYIASCMLTGAFTDQLDNIVHTYNIHLFLRMKNIFARNNKSCGHDNIQTGHLPRLRSRNRMMDACNRRRLGHSSVRVFVECGHLTDQLEEDLSDSGRCVNGNNCACYGHRRPVAHTNSNNNLKWCSGSGDFVCRIYTLTHSQPVGRVRFNLRVDV